MNNIGIVIEQRLNLQSTKNMLLDQFGTVPKLDFILSNTFLNKFKTWDQSKQNKFITVLGGKTNFTKTKHFLLDKR